MNIEKMSKGEKTISLSKTTIANLSNREMREVVTGNTYHSMDDCVPTYVSDGMSCKTDGSI